MSLQNIIVKNALKAIRLRSSTVAPDNFVAIRKGFEDACKNNPKQRGVKYRAIDIDTVRGEWVLPEKADNQKVVLYFHGGGYAIGSIVTHRPLASRIAFDAEMPLLLFNYRLAPESPYPAALHDAVKVYRWLLDTDYEAHNISFCGDSAGAGLVLATLMYLRDKKLPLPACAVLFSPWTDLAATGNSLTLNEKLDPFIDLKSIHLWSRTYANGTALTDPYISPLYGSYQGLPPLYFQVGTEEILYDDTIRTARRAEADGVAVQLEVWDDMVHVFHMFWQWLPEGKKAIGLVANFMKEKTGKPNGFGSRN